MSYQKEMIQHCMGSAYLVGKWWNIILQNAKFIHVIFPYYIRTVGKDLGRNASTKKNNFEKEPVISNQIKPNITDNNKNLLQYQNLDIHIPFNQNAKTQT